MTGLHLIFYVRGFQDQQLTYLTLESERQVGHPALIRRADI